MKGSKSKIVIDSKNGSLSWMACNPVAANLLMLFLIVAGLNSIRNVKKEILPEFSLDTVEIFVSYPGSGPEEIEQGVLLAIEEAVSGVYGIKNVMSTAREGFGFTILELEKYADPNIILSDVKNNVDAILSFPQMAERPTIRLLQFRGRVMDLVITGNVDDSVLLDYTELIRDELLQQDGITQVEILGANPRRIGVEVPEQALRSYGLTLRQIANTIANTALELPGGAIRAASGEVLLRTQERRDFAYEYRDIPLVSNNRGGLLKLGDIGTVNDTFEEIEKEAFLNNQPALRVQIMRVGDQTPISVAENVRNYLDATNNSLPEGLEITVMEDESLAYRERIELLQKNALVGLILVMLLLGLFLEPRLAFWVMLGIPISVIGSFIFLNLSGASLNMISLFAFIVTLGIVVDDAIVVGENIYEMRENGATHLDAAIEGVRQIWGPVTFAVLTNIAAFLPLTAVPGAEGNLFFQIPAVAISVLVLSLVESLFVLPAHLARKSQDNWLTRFIGYPQSRFNPALHGFIERKYIPMIRFVARHRPLAISLGVASLILCGGIVGGGVLGFSFFPRIDQNASIAQIVMPFGSPFEQSQAIRKHLEASARRVLQSYGEPEAAIGIFTRVGESFDEFPPPIGGDGSHVISGWVSLKPNSKRTISSREFTEAWRNEIGEILGAETINLTSEFAGFGGPDLEFDLTHSDPVVLDMAARELANHLRNFEGLDEINDGVSIGKPQLSFEIRPEAQSLGIDSLYLANYVRDSFYGAEALRQQRGRNEVRVLVRLPAKDRRRMQSLEQMILVAPGGGEIPLSEAANIKHEQSYTSIQRRNGRRIIRVSSSIKDESDLNASDIVSFLKAEIFPRLQSKYQGLGFQLEGEQRQQKETLASLINGYIIALFVIYGLLAIPFKSYIQPIIIMFTIPFGVVGAIFGHLLMGYDLSMISLFGIIALSGVVVNDSLVLIVSANTYRFKEKLTSFDAICRSGARRFRPIILTSLTTFFGLLPMISETSSQARFLVPMAISLGFGILFATAVVLLLVPAFYLIIEDFREWHKSDA